MSNKEKQNANPVGATSGRPHFEGMTRNKGITLIALIITIIVMLILVGVTINVALNGGLFTKAETATKQTEEKAILEEMLAMMDITDEGKIDYDTIIAKIGQKYNVESYNYPNATIAGKLGTYNYIVSETEIRIGNSSGGEGAAQLELIKTYFLGAIDETTGERPGIDLKTSETVIAEPSISELLKADSSDIKFKNNDVISDAYDNMSAISMGSEGENYYMHIKYNGIIYKVIADSTFVTKDDISVEITDVGVALGKYVEYDDKLWIVLYDEGEYGEGAQLISAEVFEADRRIGFSDSINWSDPEVIAEANLYGQTVGLENLERAIYSYNHVIENLNKKCTDLITDNSKITTVRSVGSNPSNPNSEAGKCTLEILKSWPEYNSAYPEQTVGMFYGIGKNTDENYLPDYERMLILGIAKSNNSKYYWLASRLVKESTDIVALTFNVRYMDSRGRNR